MAEFNPEAFYKVTLLRACVILKTEYPARLPFKANGEMTQAFVDAGAVEAWEELDGPEVTVQAAIQRTDHRVLQVSVASTGEASTNEVSMGVPRPDNRNLEEAVNDLPEQERMHYQNKMAALQAMGQV
jgi:hypothetical protein